MQRPSSLALTRHCILPELGRPRRFAESRSGLPVDNVLPTEQFSNVPARTRPAMRRANREDRFVGVRRSGRQRSQRPAAVNGTGTQIVCVGEPSVHAEPDSSSAPEPRGVCSVHTWVILPRSIRKISILEIVVTVPSFADAVMSYVHDASGPR